MSTIKIVSNKKKPKQRNKNKVATRRLFRIRFRDKNLPMLFRIYSKIWNTRNCFSTRVV